MAEKLFGIANFYLREKRFRAARYYLQRIVKDHPDAAVAKEANQLLKNASLADGS